MHGRTRVVQVHVDNQVGPGEDGSEKEVGRGRYERSSIPKATNGQSWGTKPVMAIRGKVSGNMALYSKNSGTHTRFGSSGEVR